MKTITTTCDICKTIIPNDEYIAKIEMLLHGNVEYHYSDVCFSCINELQITIQKLKS